MASIYDRIRPENAKTSNESPAAREPACRVPGWNNKKEIGAGKQTGKRATEVVARAHTGRLCKRYAISDKWRDRERNRDEEKRRPLARAIAGVYLLLR